MKPPAAAASPPSPLATVAAPFLSVIAAASGGDRELPRFLEALENQTIGNDQFEVIVATAGRARPVEQSVHCARPPHYTSCTAETITSALDRAARLAAGPLLAFTCTAGVPARTWLGAARRAWRETANCAGVLGRIELLQPHSRAPRVTEIYDDQWTSVQYPRAPIDRDGAINLLLSRSAFHLAGPLPLGQSDSALHDWWRRLASHGFRIVRSPMPVVRTIHP